MPITVICDECGKQYRLRGHMAGKRIRCKECQAVLHVGDDDEDDFYDDDEDLAPRLPTRRKKSRKRSDTPERGQSKRSSQFVNKWQMTVVIIVAVMTLQSLNQIFFGTAFKSPMRAIDSTLSILLSIALAIGGIGIYRRDPSGATIVDKVAMIIIVLGLLALPFLFLTLLKFGAVGIAVGIQALLSMLVRLALPAVLIYCIRHPDWNKVDEI